MTRYNRRVPARERVTSPIVTESAPSGHTHEGAPGYKRTAEAELFLLAASNMVGTKTFYESADERDKRFAALVKVVAVKNPEWMQRFLPYLRMHMNMRTAPLVAAMEATHAMLEAGIPGGRGLIDSVMQRADEPGEGLGYWTTTYSRKLPMPVKKGVADAAQRLYNERSYLKWDSARNGFRFADVLELTHPQSSAGWQGALYELMLNERHGNANGTPDSLAILRNNRQLRKDFESNPRVLLDTERLREAGMTWEDVLSLGGSVLPKRELWEVSIPAMGYMALLRNLRNFDEEGVSDEIASQVAARLSDPEQVRKSRQLPFRFLSAYLAAPSTRWAHPLSKALDVAVESIPALPGKTLILADTSASMTHQTLTPKSKVFPYQAAALFATCLAYRCGPENVDFYGFADDVFKVELPRGGSVLPEIEKFLRRIGEAGHGTEIRASVERTYAGHDRVVVFSDMQTMDKDGDLRDGWYGSYYHDDREVKDVVPANVPLYGWNLQGYEHAAMPSGSKARHELGGFSDSMFKMLPLLEAGHKAEWPF